MRLSASILMTVMVATPAMAQSAMPGNGTSTPAIVRSCAPDDLECRGAQEPLQPPPVAKSQSGPKGIMNKVSPDEGGSLRYNERSMGLSR